MSSKDYFNLLIKLKKSNHYNNLLDIPGIVSIISDYSSYKYKKTFEAKTKHHLDKFKKLNKDKKYEILDKYPLFVPPRFNSGENSTNRKLFIDNFPDNVCEIYYDETDKEECKIIVKLDNGILCYYSSNISSSGSCSSSSCSTESSNCSSDTSTSCSSSKSSNCSSDTSTSCSSSNSSNCSSGTSNSSSRSPELNYAGNQISNVKVLLAENFEDMLNCGMDRRDIIKFSRYQGIDYPKLHLAKRHNNTSKFLQHQNTVKQNNKSFKCVVM